MSYSATIGYLYIPKSITEDVTINVNKNGNLFYTKKSSEIKGIFDEEKDGYNYPIKLNLTQLDNEDILVFTFDHLKDWYWAYVIQIDRLTVTFKTKVVHSPDSNGTNGFGQGQSEQELGNTGTNPTTEQSTIPLTQKSTSTKNNANQITITPTKTTTTISQKSKELVLTTNLKLGNKIAKGKTVTYVIQGKKYKTTTNKKGIAKLKLNKKQLQKNN